MSVGVLQHLANLCSQEDTNVSAVQLYFYSAANFFMLRKINSYILWVLTILWLGCTVHFCSRMKTIKQYFDCQTDQICLFLLSTHEELNSQLYFNRELQDPMCSKNKEYRKHNSQWDSLHTMKCKTKMHNWCNPGF